MQHRRALRIAVIGAFVAAATLLTNAGASVATTNEKKASSLIICVCGPTFDPFFGAYKAGNDLAAKNLKVNVQYSAAPDYNALAADTVPLIRAAIAKKPAALVIGDYIPSAFNPEIKKAVKAGIPVVITSVGDTEWKALGAIGFVGENPILMGQTAAELQLKAGVKYGMCVNHLPGAGTLQARCDAYIKTMKAAGKKAYTLVIPTADNMNDKLMTNDMVGALRSHPTVDGIFTLGPSQSVDAVAAREQAGRPKVVVGTTDLSVPALNAVKNGSLLFALDQQPFLQGYYGVQIAAQYIQFRVAPAGQVSTGPFVINKANVNKVLAVMAAHPGIRGTG